MSDEEIRSRVAEVQRLAAETEAEVVSEDGGVRVVATPGGDVKEIDLRLKAFELSGVELGELIAETVKSAAAKAEQEMSTMVASTMGDVFPSRTEESR